MTIARSQPARAAGKDGASSSQRRSRTEAIVAMSIVAAAAMFATWRVVGPKSSWDWWYDEMWRLDMLRRTDWWDAYLSEATPLPPAWFFMLRAVLRPMYLSPLAVRSIAAGLVATAPVALGWFAGRTLQPDGKYATLAAAIAGSAVALTVFAGGFAAEVFSYLNNYAFESGASIALLTWVASTPGQGSTARRTATALLPVFTIGGLLFLPGIAAVTLFRAARSPHRKDEVRACIATLASAGAVGISVYMLMYRAAMQRDSTATFFVEEQFRGGLLEAPSAIWLFMRRSLEWASIIDHRSVVVLLAAWGAVVVTGRLPAITVSASGALVALLAVSRFTGFPAVANRVHAPLILLIAALPIIGALHLAHLAGKWFSPSVALGAAGTAAVVFAAINWSPQNDEPPWRGIRWLTADMRPIAETPYRHNIVVSYHWMSKWYTHDRFVNGRPNNDVSYALLAENRLLAENAPRVDQPVYQNLSRLVDEIGRDDAAVWCIQPYDMGPDAFGVACKLDDPDRVREVVLHGYRAEIILWKPRT